MRMDSAVPEGAFAGANRSLPLKLAVVAAIGGLLFGYDTAVISGAVNAIDHNFIAPRHLSETAADTLSGWTVSSALLGCVIGSGMAGSIGDRLGRRNGMMVAALLFFVSALGSAIPGFGFAPLGSVGPEALLPFICYRVLGGVAIGMASALCPGICPYHGDCVEGLVSGPAIAARAGMAGENIAVDHPVWADVAHTIGAMIHNLVMVGAPQRIMLGGGVIERRPELFPAIRHAVMESLADYAHAASVERDIDQFIVLPALGRRAGPLGALALASDAFDAAVLRVDPVTA